MHRTLICIGFRYDVTDNNLQRLLRFVFFLMITLYLHIFCVKKLNGMYYVCSLNENMYRFYLLFITKNNLLQIKKKELCLFQAIDKIGIYMKDTQLNS
jgi:hypothetical protein